MFSFISMFPFFLFTRFLIYLRDLFLVCVFSFLFSQLLSFGVTSLFARLLFYLRDFFYVCVVSFLFACLIFYFHVLFFVWVISVLFAACPF